MDAETMKNAIKEYRLSDITLWLLCLEKISDADFEEMYHCCSEARRAAADRIRSDLKRKQSVGAGYLLYLLKRRFLIEEDPVVLPGGKPVFRENSGVHFNLSHSGKFAALAFGNAPLGVDIECVKRENLNVAKRFFTAEENDFLTGKPQTEQADVFYKIWTGKEAVMKAAGKGLSISPGSFSVLGEIVECCGNPYALYRQRITEDGQILWMSAAKALCTKDVDSHRIL